MLRYNFIALQLIALILAIIAITTSSWEKVTLKDDDALQTIYHSPLLTALTTFTPPIRHQHYNVTGYILTINSGLLDICVHLQHSNHLFRQPQRCKQTVARPSIGLAIIGVIFLVIGIVCTGFADEEMYDDRQVRWLCYGSALSVALAGLLLFTSHWTYSMSSELQLPTAYVRFGYSTYLIVTAAVLSLLSMSLVLWRVGSLRSSSTTTRVPVTEECTNNPTICASNSYCFQNSRNYSSCQKSCPKNWSCNNGNISCSFPVEQMVTEVSHLKHEDVISGFAIDQLCIAKHGCEYKSSFDNPSWFDNILVAFIKPYVEKHDNWNSVIDHCHKTFSKIPIVGKYFCQQKMAEHHITVDLKNAVSNNGCGTQHDWDAVGKIIVSCVKEADINIPFGENYAISEVFRQRNLVRENCIKTRREKGFQIEF
ncbi:hypothetical protein I4U23_012935 [Adineta vaga]|nr:hypothetical protein I4U23_012935 [Adineta vaga]